MPLPWTRLSADRFQPIAACHPGFAPRPVREDAASVRETARTHSRFEGLKAGIVLRKKQGYAETLAHHHPGTIKNGVFLDLGARGPSSSIRDFILNYPQGRGFKLHAFEADASLSPAYKQPRWRNVTLHSVAVSTFDGPCFFSSDSSVSAHMSRTPTTANDVPVTCLDFRQWLDDNIRPSQLVVAKIDIERAEFALIPYLLRHPHSLRLIDELYIECHHTETWNMTGHSYKDCLAMYQALQTAGVWTHEWF